MDSPLRIGTVGLGRLGRFHAETVAYRLPGTSLAAVCSIDERERADARQTFPSAHVFSSYEQMLQEGDLDAVVLSTPSARHCGQLMQALDAGLHVFVEKPLGVTTEECRTVVEHVEQHPNRVVMLGFMRRYDPSYIEMKARIDSGELGRPILFRSYSVDPHSSINGALAYLPHSSGQFLDMAVHDIDLARWLLESEPTVVTAAGSCYAHPEFAEFEDGDNVAAFLQFENNAMGFLLAGRTAPHGYQVETELIGTKASLRVGLTPQRNHLEILDSQGIRKVCSQGFLERFSEAYIAELQAFVRCIQEACPAEITVHDGLRATEIALAAQKAFRTGSSVRL